MLNRGSKGDDVRKIQSALIELGYDLPRWGVDGDLGTETVDAMARFLRDHDKNVDDDADVISDGELELLFSMRGREQQALVGPALPTGRFHDVRTIASQENVGERRGWGHIDGIVLHQTACNLGEKPTRWATVGAHFGVTRAGQVVWMHDFERVVWHANLFNKWTVGIEMDGTYEGIEGRSNTFWHPPDEPHREPQIPTDALVSAAQATVHWICAEVARHGGKITKLLAHRQASNQRQSDPGSALWKRVAMPLHAELGLTDGGRDYTVGTGARIPEDWNSDYAGNRY